MRSKPYHRILAKMAPHALIDFHDSSGYYPSISSNAFLRATAVQECSKASITDLEKNPSSKKLLAFSRHGPCVWHLSTEENEDVEESMRYFSGMRLLLPAQCTNRTSIRSRLAAQRNQPENFSFDTGSEI